MCELMTLLGPLITRLVPILAFIFFWHFLWWPSAVSQVPPPFRPEVKNILDPKFVPKTYLNEAAHDSFDRNAKVRSEGGAGARVASEGQ